LQSWGQNGAKCLFLKEEVEVLGKTLKPDLSNVLARQGRSYMYEKYAEVTILPRQRKEHFQICNKQLDI